VQILVVVANIQVRTLKADVEKGFMGSAFHHELIDPNPDRKRVGRRQSSSNVHSGCPQGGKGISLILLNLVSDSYGNVSELGNASRCPGKSSLFFLTASDDPGIILYGDRVRWPVKRFAL